ncbi:MAG TPA: 2-oxoacid:ferredoxin oxidoreductase subunit beta [Dehalococcoidia bacterium]|jgi:2-oxoglutarate ferredoxin oxidoreductase subunit beta|nr:2-oxoacid:ferredoxin oxidoreductase subunit beta [Dehalococcoidia bacterium]
MVKLADYAGLDSAWCPGCGNFGILAALKQALVELDIEPHRVLITSGIGQAGKLPHYLRCNLFNSLHGRPVPPAIGAKIANPDLVVIAVSGDGDAYGEGGNHFVHAARRNHDITYLVHDNQVYGLTKGQASPTSDEDFITKTTPHGAPLPVNPIALAIAAGASFVARGFAGDVEHLVGLLRAGITHRGFALIDVLQPCVSFNHKNTYRWYRERVYKLEDEPDYDPADRMAAFAKAQEWGERIPTGLIYRKVRATFEEQLPALRRGSLVEQKLEPAPVARLLGEFT